MLPKVSIIIVNYNRKEIIDCIRSIKSNNYTKDKMEIIVVDNNSFDNSISEIRKKHPDVKIIRLNKNYGYGIACNYGAYRSNGKYIVFLTPDNIVDEKWLQNLVNKIDVNKSIGTVTSKVMYQSQTNKINSMGCFLSSFGICGSINSTNYIGKSSEVFAPSGAAFIIAKDTFQKIGGFDDNLFMYAEDVDLGWRVLNIGQKNIVSKDSITYHKTDVTTLTKGDIFYFYNTRNNFLIIIKNATFPFIIPMLIFSLFLHTSRAIVFTLVGRLSYAKATFKGIFWPLANSTKLMKIRKSFKNRNSNYTKFVTGMVASIPLLVSKIFKHLR